MCYPMCISLRSFSPALGSRWSSRRWNTNIIIFSIILVIVAILTKVIGCGFGASCAAIKITSA